MPAIPAQACNVCKKPKPKKEFKKSEKTGELRKTCEGCRTRVITRQRALRAEKRAAKNGVAPKKRNKSNGQKITDVNKALERARAAELLGVSGGADVGDNECIWFLRGLAVAEGCTVVELVARLATTYKKEQRQ